MLTFKYVKRKQNTEEEEKEEIITKYNIIHYINFPEITKYDNLFSCKNGSDL